MNSDHHAPVGLSVLGSLVRNGLSGGPSIVCPSFSSIENVVCWEPAPLPADVTKVNKANKVNCLSIATPQYYKAQK